MLPRILKGFALYVDGENFIGRCETVKLPDLNLKTEAYRAGGMDAEVDQDMGMEKLDVQFTLAEYSPAIIKKFGLFSADKQIVLRGGIQRQGEAAIPVVIRLQGGIKQLTRDDWKQGEKGSMQCTANCNSYIETQGGEELVNIDILNYKRVIGGVDQLASMRAALGM